MSNKREIAYSLIKALADINMTKLMQEGGRCPWCSYDFNKHKAHCPAQQAKVFLENNSSWEDL